MSRFNRTLALAAVSLTALVAAQGSAQAGGFGIREQSATGQGMSFAGVAAGSGGLSSIFWNPATITMAPGWQSENHFSIVVPQVKLTPIAGTSPALLPLGPSGDIGLDAVVPAGYNSYQINDRLWVGLYTGAPFGLTTKPNPVWAGQTYARTTSVLTFEAQPTLGYKVNDWLSLGVGLRAQYFDVLYKSATGIAPTSGSSGLEGDSFGWGYSLGATVTPLPGTEIGIGFRSSIEHNLDGEAGYVVPIKARVVLPETVTLGIRQRITDALTINGTVEWTNWSRLGFPRVYNGLTGGLLATAPALPLDYKDGWFYSIGAEYRVNPALLLRAGIAYEDSPITDVSRSPRLPDDDRWWLSVGATYNWNQKLSFDIGYSYIFAARDTKVAVVSGNPTYNPRTPIPLPLVADVDANAHIVSFSVKYRWDDPVVAVPAPVVIRKN